MTVRTRTSSASTLSQKYLAEIRDELVARPLANTLVASSRDVAREILLAIDALNERLDRMDATVTLMARVTGVNPSVLSDDELAVLTDAGATDEDAQIPY